MKGKLKSKLRTLKKYERRLASNGARYDNGNKIQQIVR